MIHHDPIFSGSAIGSDAVVSLSGSFTGSGTIANADTASKVRGSASFGLGIVNDFIYDGSTNQIVTLDTSSAHFIEGVDKARADDTGSFFVSASFVNQTMSFSASNGNVFDVPITETGSFLETASFSTTNTLLALTRADGSTFSIQVISASHADTASVTDSTLSNGPLVDLFRFDGSQPAQVNIDGYSASAATSLTNLSSSAATALTNLSSSAAAALTAYSSSEAADDTAYSASAAAALTDYSASAADALTSSISDLSSSAASALTAYSASEAADDTAYSASAATALTNQSASSAAALTDYSASAADALTSSISDLSSSAAAALTAYSSSEAADDTAYSASAAGSQTALSASIAATISGSSIPSASSADTATSASSAQNATSASSAQNATSASSAQNAVSASSAQNATSASRAAIAGQVQYSLTQGLGIENFTYNGGTDGVIVQVDTSSAHYLTPIGDYTSSLSASTSTARDAISASAATALTNTSASFSTSQTNLSSSANLARRNYYQSSSITPGREEDSFRLTKGDGTVDTLIFSTASFVKSVNGNTPAANGNVAIAIASVETGLSSSIPASADDGDVWIVSGETGPNTGSNGKAFIYSTASAQWFEISNLDQIENDARYVQISGDTMTGQLVLPAANPTLANQATRKGYVDLFYDSSSLNEGASELSLHKGDNTTIDVVSLAGISVSSSVSASNVGVANGRRIIATANPTQNYIAVNDGSNNAEIGAANNLELNMNTDGGAVGTIAFQNNGTQIASVDQDGTGSFAWIDATASVANRVRHDLTNGPLVDTFTYDGGAAATVNISTYSASAAAALTSSISNNSSSAATALTNLSASFAGGSVNTSSNANTASRVNRTLSNGPLVDAFTYNGSVDATVDISTYSSSAATSQTALSASIAASISGSSTVSASYALTASFVEGSIESSSFAARSVSASNALSASTAVSASRAQSALSSSYSLSASRAETASRVEFPLSGGLGVEAFIYDGSSTQHVQVDTSSGHFKVGVSSSIADLFTGSIRLNDAEVSGSFTGSLVGEGSLSGSFSGSLIGEGELSGSFSGSIEGSDFTGSSAFTGSFDFANADVSNLIVRRNVLAVSASSTLLDGYAYIVTSSTANTTQSLPPTPLHGANILFANMDDRPTLLARNGNKIMGLDEDMTLNVEQVSFELVYDANVMGWVIYGARAIT